MTTAQGWHDVREDLILRLVRDPHTPTEQIHEELHKVNLARGNNLNERPWLGEEFERLYEDRKGRTA